jgi:hypothetical protein
MKFDILVFFENLSRKFQVSLKSDKNNGYFTWRPVHIDDYLAEFLLKWKSLQTKAVEKIRTLAVYEIMCKNAVEPDRPLMTITLQTQSQNT